MKVIVDGDSVCYKACFSTQYSTYELEEEGILFRYFKDITNYLALQFDEDERPTFFKKQIVEPVNHACHIVNIILQGIKNDTGADELVIFLSGDKNFRKQIPYPVTYKGNRPEKPIHLQDVRAFISSNHKAIVTDGYEADDAIGIYATQNPGCIIASVDKDLRQIPGIHYHLDRKDITEVSELDGLRSLYKQMLIGDRVDNIIGVSGIGEKISEKLIGKLYQESDMDRVVREHYKMVFKNDWEGMYKANMSLLYILRSEEEYKEINETSQREAKGTELTEVDKGPVTEVVRAP